MTIYACLTQVLERFAKRYGWRDAVLLKNGVASMRANGLELRQRIVCASQANHAKAEVAAVLGVDRGTITRNLRLAADGELALKPIPGRPPTISTEQHAALDLRRRVHPTATLAEQCKHWEAEHGMWVSVATMSRMTARQSCTRKTGQR